MSIKPILFNIEIVRAISEGRKTVTRRVVKPRSPKACGFYVTHRKSDGAFMGVYDYDEHERMFDSPQAQPAYPGDILYIPQAWKCIGQAGGLRWTGRRRSEVDLYPAQMKLRFERTNKEKGLMENG